jgi:hypothetical protein
MRAKNKALFRVLNILLLFILVVGLFFICQYAQQSKTASTTPASYLEAVKAAEYYADCINTSYADTIYHLRSMGFEEDEAIYGADNCNVNWNEEAYDFWQMFEQYYSNDQLAELIDLMELAGYTEENIGYALYRHLAKQN